MSYLDAKPGDSKEQLLNDIMAAANQGHMPGLPLRPFAALVVKVADETAETVAELRAHITYLNDQNSKLQRWVVVLAIAALIGTAVQTGAAIYALFAQADSATNRSSQAAARAPESASKLLPPTLNAQSASSVPAPAPTSIPATPALPRASEAKPTQ